MSRLHCGVDFGTTNSTVGLCAPGGDPVLIPVEGDQVTIPSALFSAKIELTDAAAAVIALREPGLSLALPVTRDTFETASAELAARIGAAIDEALRAAAVAAAAIDTVILTGGGAQVPLVRAAATACFGGARIARSDQFGSVGLGLAVDAARRFG